MSAAPLVLEVRESAAHRASAPAVKLMRRNSPQIALLVLVSLAMLKWASALLVPVAISMLLSLLFGPGVRWLRRLGVPVMIGAAVLVFGSAALLGAAGVLLARPASEWLSRAPETVPELQQKIRKIVRPITTIQQTAEQMSRAASSTSASTMKVAVQDPALMSRFTSNTLNALAGFFTVLFLTYFLASTDQLFKRKVAMILAEREDQDRIMHAVAEIEHQTARYLGLNTVISVGLGLATWGLLAIAGLPNGALWGAVAAVLNFIPYVGALISLVLIGGACLITFDGIEKTLIVSAIYFTIHTFTGNIVTPLVLGRGLPLNKVAVFVSLIFWAWLWGVAGAILAVPLTVMLKVICDQVDRLKPVAVLLDS
jgi:predicted PurR-regulated permease PerM